MPFKVVTFGDDSVEAVPTSWLEKRNGQLICYWPLGGKQMKKRIINQEIPDKDVWVEHEVRILGKSEYKDYHTASLYAKKGEETSNIDSDEGARPHKKPRRYQDSAHTSDDGNCENADVSEQNQLEVIDCPSAPEITANDGNIEANLRCDRDLSRATTLQQLHEMGPSDVPQSNSRRNRSLSMTPSNSQRDRSLSTTPSNLQRDRSLSTTPSNSQCDMDLSLLSEASGLQLDSSFKVEVLSKLQQLETSIKEIKDIVLRKSEAIADQDILTDQDIIESLLPEGTRLDTMDELNKFEKQLEDGSFRKKIVHSLASLEGGSNLGKLCRSIMRSILTNGLMSKYSVAGQKGKLAFKSTAIFKVILKALKKSTKSVYKDSDMMAEIGDVLRNAPNQPGGSNYKKHQVSNTPAKTQCVAHMYASDDSDSP